MIKAKKKLGLAVGVSLGLAMTGQAALAQNTTSVQIYGIVDAGVEYIDSVAVNGRRESLTQLSGSNQLASRLGLRGAEDLGGGLKAVFNLEAGFNPDNGVLLQGGRLFGRAAVVGLEGGWGGVLLGRQRNTIFDLTLRYDPLEYATYGITAHDNAFFTQRPDNSIKYTYTQGPISGSLLYSLGRDSLTGTPPGSQSEVPGNSKIGRQLGANLNYVAGPLSVGFGFDQQHGVTAATASDTDRRYFLAATYVIAKTKLYAGVQHRKNEIPAVDVTSDIYWIGVRQPITGQFGIAAQLSQQKFKDTPDKATLFGTSLYYDLSKRTQLYLNVGYANNSGASTQGVRANMATTPGGNQTGVVAGMLHKF